MTLLEEKLKEVLAAIAPIVVIVVLLSLTLVKIEREMMGRFFIGSVFLLIGLAVFLVGVDLGMTPMGKYLGETVGSSKTYFSLMAMSFLIGFSVTAAEPDLAILGAQIESATGGALPQTGIVLIVSVGVGIMIALGMLRILRGFGIHRFFLIAYAAIFCISFFSKNEFIAMAFDSSGATTGALTTPFVLVLCSSVSARKGGREAEADSFGLVGIMSAGPILAVLLMSLFTGSDFQGTAEEFVYTQGLLAPFLHAIPHLALESVLALLPITVIFLIMNRRQYHLSPARLRRIFMGLAYTFLGLVLFLTGVNRGFMEMGRFIGASLITDHQKLLPFLGLLIGLVVVLAEPAVHVLGTQVEDVTGGHIKNQALMASLSIGVGLAVMLSLIRILTPGMQLWHFLLPGFAIALILSFFVPSIFTGIAFDAGGVASGPMTTTFVLSFAQGVASLAPGSDVLVDGFGIIGMVAMVPVLAIQILGLLYKLQMRRIEKQRREARSSESMEERV
ncbi:MAG: DUF1538 domain-containing protein [Peptoniphilaceae bacterium]|nr:DUF1538 domain-containing protein [Peptoniphilaceae bacterium]MDY3075364.1 DUF1538 domain-containing protein [Peptoniphilaceae bacterium]